MRKNESKMFWAGKTCDYHRRSDDDFFSNKALEHSLAIKNKFRTLGAVDLGCGSGELLKHLAKLITIDVGVDYSESMLEMAEINLKGAHIQLLGCDIFDYLPTSTHGVWMTTSAVNQYLEPEQQNKFIKSFFDNKSAQLLCLFDCLDPIRYKLLNFGSRYTCGGTTWEKNGGKNRIVFLTRYIRNIVRIGLMIFMNRKWIYLKDPAMGFAYFPYYWSELAEAAGKCGVEYRSSLFYEYRYHVIIEKVTDVKDDE